MNSKGQAQAATAARETSSPARRPQPVPAASRGEAAIGFVGATGNRTALRLLQRPDVLHGGTQAGVSEEPSERRAEPPASSTVDSVPGAGQRKETTGARQPAARSRVMPAADAGVGNDGLLRLLVEDGTSAGPEQMTRSRFLHRLRSAVCLAADEGLADTEHTARGCPVILHALRAYSRVSAERLEEDLRKFAPEASGVTTANDYVPLVADCVRASVRRWAETGEVSGVPEGLLTSLPGPEFPGLLGSLAGAGGLLFRGNAGGPGGTPNPAAVQARLGTGQSLPGAVRTRMEGAFGVRFGHVRVHTGTTARRLSNRYRARAFTVGLHVAFGAGQYRPGLPVGDALLAHELAHTVQQGNAGERDGTPPGRASALEADADDTAVSVMEKLLGRGRGRQRRPRLRVGLALQRCASTPARPTQATGPPTGTEAGRQRAPEAGETAEEDAAAARARAIDALVGDADCQPTPVSLKKMASIPGASLTNFGYTKPAQISRNISPRFDPRKGECFLKDFRAATLSFDHLVYVEPGAHRYGNQTRHDPGCGKDLPLYVDVTNDAAKLFKAGEVEHCRDIHHAFDLTYARFNTAAAAVKGEGRFSATGMADCTAKIKKKISDRIGIDYDQVLPVFQCLLGKTEERDTKGWHDVDVNVTSDKRTDPACTKIVHELDHTKILPDVGTHSTEDLVKGCGEPGPNP